MIVPNDSYVVYLKNYVEFKEIGKNCAIVCKGPVQINGKVGENTKIEGSDVFISPTSEINDNCFLTTNGLCVHEGNIKNNITIKCNYFIMIVDSKIGDNIQVIAQENVRIDGTIGKNCYIKANVIEVNGVIGDNFFLNKKNCLPVDEIDLPKIVSLDFYDDFENYDTMTADSNQKRQEFKFVYKNTGVTLRTRGFYNTKISKHHNSIYLGSQTFEEILKYYKNTRDVIDFNEHIKDLYPMSNALQQFVDILKKKEENSKLCKDLEIHDKFKCPITYQIMDIPVTLDGYSFDLKSLEKLPTDFNLLRYHPITNNKFHFLEINPNRKLQNQINNIIYPKIRQNHVV